MALLRDAPTEHSRRCRRRSPRRATQRVAGSGPPARVAASTASAATPVGGQQHVESSARRGPCPPRLDVGVAASRSPAARRALEQVDEAAERDLDPIRIDRPNAALDRPRVAGHVGRDRCDGVRQLRQRRRSGPRLRGKRGLRRHCQSPTRNRRRAVRRMDMRFGPLSGHHKRGRVASSAQAPTSRRSCCRSSASSRPASCGLGPAGSTPRSRPLRRRSCTSSPLRHRRSASIACSRTVRCRPTDQSNYADRVRLDAVQGPRPDWVADHRKHHAHTTRTAIRNSRCRRDGCGPTGLCTRTWAGCSSVGRDRAPALRVRQRRPRDAVHPPHVRPLGRGWHCDPGRYRARRHGQLARGPRGRAAGRCGADLPRPPRDLVDQLRCHFFGTAFAVDDHAPTSFGSPRSRWASPGTTTTTRSRAARSMASRAGRSTRPCGAWAPPGTSWNYPQCQRQKLAQL